MSAVEKQYASTVILPRYWVPEEEVLVKTEPQATANRTDADSGSGKFVGDLQHWMLGFRKITSATTNALKS